jgi:hypothetical protein
MCVIAPPLRLRPVGGTQATQVAQRLHQQAENAHLAFGAGMGGLLDLAFGTRDLPPQRPYEAALERGRVE